MSDLDTQIRTYAHWLADTADAAHDAGPGPAQPTASSPWRRRAVMLAAVAAGVLLVVALGSVVRAPSDAPPADLSATTTTAPSLPIDTVTLAAGYEVAVVGDPVMVNGVEVWQGAPAPPLTAEAEVVLIDSTDSTAVLLEPMHPTEVALSDEAVDGLPETVVTAGALDAVAVVVHARSYSGAAPDVRCVLLTSTVAEDWIGTCGGTSEDGAVITSQGRLGSWILWSGIPDGAALVVLRGADGASLHQYPVARTAAFPAGALTEAATELVAYDADGETLAVVDVPVTSPTTSTPVSETDGLDDFDVTSAFGDVGADALAVTTDGRVVAAAGPELFVRDGSGTIDSIDLPEDIEVTNAWVGADDIAVAWGSDRGVEVDLGTGEVITQLTRRGDAWTRNPTEPDGYVGRLARPSNSVGLDLLVHGDSELPEVEGAGCFEVIGAELGQSWTLPRSADCSAHVAELAALADGGYLAVLRTMDVVLADQPGTFPEFHPFVLHADGSIETLPPIDGTDSTSDTRVDVQPGPDGLTVLTVDGTTATIEHVPVP